MILDIPLLLTLFLCDRNANHSLTTTSDAKTTDDDSPIEVYELVKVKNPTTAYLHTQTQGPYQILQVHMNGTLTIQRHPHLIDRVNTRCLQLAFG